jgi:DNA topoisomerase-6 subunit B
MAKTNGVASKASAGEVQVQKSPAEFFAENQAIAGFDNLGKSLYTSLRELVENSLDACESIHELPEISIEIKEYTQEEFNALDVMKTSPRKKRDMQLFETKKKDKKPPKEATDVDEITTVENSGKKRKKAPQDAYFKLTVKDNGCGMSHSAIPNLLGRVLSGSKYGVRQTRGKFGLGAKMALIWAKKSTGQPIRIMTSHRPDGGVAPERVSACVLDIDIYKNAPRILEHTTRKNTDGWMGTEMSVLIAGNWTTYKSRIVQYLQQLAIITPYAVLELAYINISDPKRNLHVRYDRRSDQMPPPAKTIKHHPASVNNLVIQQLIQFTKTRTLFKFLSIELSTVSPPLARRLVTELGFDESMPPSSLEDKEITRLVQLLRQVQLFKAPDGSCLSPLGEYNLNLGIRKVLEPDLIATSRDKPGAYEGHPFLVEAAVSLGGKEVKEGITVIRFANRIPLLFEGGADVATRVANTKIRWSNYKMDYKRDRIGVFVSIVSTKVPFKGTSKEYIGDDATEIQQSVKRALQSCCQQLRGYLAKRSALKDAQTRKSRMAKYVPDVGRSLFGILDSMRARQAELSLPEAPPSQSPTKRLRLDRSAAQQMIERLNRGEVTEQSLAAKLTESIDDQLNVQEEGTDDKGSAPTQEAQPLYLVPLYNLDDDSNDISHPLFTFRPIMPILRMPAMQVQE